MSIAIYGRKFDESHIPQIQQLFDILHQRSRKLYIYESYLPYLQSRIDIKAEFTTFRKHAEIDNCFNLLISIGGDGTLLETINFVRDSGIPVLGINTGRLGFLSNTGTEEIEIAINKVLDGDFELDKRALLSLETSDKKLFKKLNVALNELTVHKKDSSSMMTIHAYIDNEYLNSYWADGLIISTPTGSTAYSLSCGGPIVVPGSENFIITPIAAHNMNVRPVVVPIDKTIKLRVEGRSKHFLASLDSISETIDSSVELTIRQANFQLNLVQLDHQNFLQTMRSKLMWGIDRRNY